MSSYLVTGGAGFIGSHLSAELLKRGHRVRVADNFVTGYRHNLRDGVELMEADLADPEAARRAVEGIDYVLHQAAIPSVPRSVANPVESHRANVDATLICERPRVSPHVNLMCEYIAQDLALTVAQVNVKGTTTEKMGFAGREEGIAASAVALLETLAPPATGRQIHMSQAKSADLEALWAEHVKYEFETSNTEDTLATMVEDAYVNHIPVMTGGVGKAELREFYAKHFIPQMPPDTEMVPLSRTVGADRLVDEMVFKFTHTIPMDWMLPGIAPTGRRVEVALVAIVHFRDGKLAYEHIYWDQASVLVQIGLLNPDGLPVAGVEAARKALQPTLPSNTLMAR